MNITHTTTKVDNRKTIPQKFGVLAELHKMMGLYLTGDVELGHMTAASGDIRGSVSTGEGRASTGFMFKRYRT